MNKRLTKMDVENNAELIMAVMHNAKLLIKEAGCEFDRIGAMIHAYKSIDEILYAGKDEVDDEEL